MKITDFLKEDVFKTIRIIDTEKRVELGKIDINFGFIPQVGDRMYVPKIKRSWNDTEDLIEIEIDKVLYSADAGTGSLVRAPKYGIFLFAHIVNKEDIHYADILLDTNFISAFD